MLMGEVGGHILVAVEDTKSNDGNGNAVFVVREGVEQQEEGNGGAILDRGWY